MEEHVDLQNEVLADNEDKEKKSHRTAWWIGGAALVLLLSGAALVGGRLLGKNSNPLEDNMPAYIKSEELPAEEPEARGVLNDFGEGGSLIVQEYVANDALGLDNPGEGAVVYSSDEDGPPDDDESSGNGQEGESVTTVMIGGQKGPVVEVVTSARTRIYKDVTPPVSYDFNGRTEPDLKETEIHQEVEEIQLSDIGEKGLITVWGERNGDRIQADVILYYSFEDMTFSFSQ